VEWQLAVARRIVRPAARCDGGRAGAGPSGGAHGWAACLQRLAAGDGLRRVLRRRVRCIATSGNGAAEAGERGPGRGGAGTGDEQRRADGVARDGDGQLVRADGRGRPLERVPGTVPRGILLPCRAGYCGRAARDTATVQVKGTQRRRPFQRGLT
jgi:hypothetical protein